MLKHQDRELLATKLRMARKATGLSTRAVAELLQPNESVSHGTIANYEKSRSFPTVRTLAAIAELYGRPLEWFIDSSPVLLGVRYRNIKSKVTVSDRHRYEGEAQRWLDAYRRIEQKIGQPLRCEARFVPTEAEASLSARDAANFFRREVLNLDDPQPIASTTELLTRAGVRAIELRCDVQIDGLAAEFGDEHVVVVNPTISSDRGRMNTLHELRHIRAKHCDASDVQHKEMESDAFEFASHTLLPDSMLKEAFKGRSFVRLVEFKERFGISLAAMIYRAEHAQVISNGEAKHLWIEFSRRGWRSEGAEPGRVGPDRATRFEQLLEAAINDKGLTWEQASDVSGIRVDELQDRIDSTTRVVARRQAKGGTTENNGLRLVR